RGHTVRVIAMLSEDPSDRCLPFEDLAAAGAELVEIRLPPRSYRAERKRGEALLAERPTVAHSHGDHADYIAASAAQRAGRVVMSTVHGFTGGSVRNRIYEWLDCRVLRTLDAVIPVSAPLRERLIRAHVPAPRQTLIPNAYFGPSQFEARADA